MLFLVPSVVEERRWCQMMENNDSFNIYNFFFLEGYLYYLQTLKYFNGNPQILQI